MPISMFRSAHLLALVLVAVAPCAALAQPAVNQLQTLPDFRIELLLKADKQIHGSWICMGKDNKGRLLLGGQRGQPVTRLTLNDGQIVKREDLKLPVSE